MTRKGSINLVQPTTKKKRKQVRRACMSCRIAKTACSEGRPCERCLSLEIGGQCSDAPQKRRPSNGEESRRGNSSHNSFDSITPIFSTTNVPPLLASPVSSSPCFTGFELPQFENSKSYPPPYQDRSGSASSDEGGEVPPGFAPNPSLVPVAPKPFRPIHGRELTDSSPRAYLSPPENLSYYRVPSGFPPHGHHEGILNEKPIKPNTMYSPQLPIRYPHSRDTNSTNLYRQLPIHSWDEQGSSHYPSHHPSLDPRGSDCSNPRMPPSRESSRNPYLL